MISKSSFAVLLMILFCSSTAFALNPSRTYKQKPDKFNLKFEQKEVKTNDGAATLKVWHIASKKKTTNVVLIAHNGEGNMGDHLDRAVALSDTFNVVMFDYRGYGESSEFEIDNNMYVYPHFQDDMASMIDHVRKTHSNRFSLYGWGIGGGLALGVGFGRVETRAIVADTPFLSMEDLEERFSSWDEPMEVPFAGYERRYEPETALANGPGKHLEAVGLIVGSNDKVMKKADMVKLKNLQKKLVKGVYVVENPDRKDNFRTDKAAYTAKLKSWLAPK